MTEEPGIWFRFTLGVLACWRVTHLLAREDGPLDVFARIRARLGESFAGKLMDCFHCLSFWIAAPLAFFVASRPLEIAVAWLGLSGAACLLERLGQEPVVIQRLPPTVEGEEKDGLLRPEERRDEELTSLDGTAGRGPGAGTV